MSVGAEMQDDQKETLRVSGTLAVQNAVTCEESLTVSKGLTVTGSLGGRLAPPINWGPKDVELNVQEGDLIEVTFQGSAKGSFQIDIIDSADVTTSLTKSKLSVYYLELPKNSKGNSVSISDIFKASKTGVAKFHLHTDLVYTEQNYSWSFTSMIAKVLLNQESK